MNLAAGGDFDGPLQSLCMPHHREKTMRESHEGANRGRCTTKGEEACSVFKKKNGPTQPFTHADDCKILKADPTTRIEWVEVSAGHWEAVCACGHEFFHEHLTDDRERLDPYEPSTFRHAGQCEHRDRPILLCSGPS